MNDRTNMELAWQPMPKIVFFVKPDQDAFINPIIAHLSHLYAVKKVTVREVSQIERDMLWADICWFEWCDDLIVHASKLPIASFRKVVCRLHSYEAFAYYPYHVNWRAVDKVVFVGQPIQEYVLKHVPALRLEQTVVIPNGVPMDQYPLVERDKGFNIAYVGYINYKKGPMILLHAFNAIHKMDARYKLFIAGTYQEIRFQSYFNQMIAELGLTDCIQFDGWQNDVNPYLRDKHFIVSSSPLESQHKSIMEAMATGIKPLVHHFYGAKKVYEEAYLWNTMDDLLEMVTEEGYRPSEYRSFIELRYSFSAQIIQIEKLLNQLTTSGP
ncbi:glycosyltransferase family 4 protein [Cohnella mopanensis]|uniref:glycosyltransferase family 4 protein n=1 Tax=Cohnella mopanensis TaxID=2911966 RepID=UPI001EF834D5|nr:glycosyltransferase family 4 protein [Cohnella mopanensis]